MKCCIIHFALMLATTLVLIEVAPAQGTSGGQGVVASIPGSVVRGHEQGPGLLSILAGTAPPNYGSDSARPTNRLVRDTTSRQMHK